jgi:hypothetical protein
MVYAVSRGLKGPPGGEFNQLSNSVFNCDENYQKFTEFTLGHFPIEAIKEADEVRDYPVNSKGFRGPEFGKVDLLAAGCSQTFGMGVDENQTWPNLTAKTLNLSYANLGLPGTSIQKIVESIIFYIKEYGLPKVVCVNFPSLYRFRFALRSDILIYPYPKNLYSPDYTQTNIQDINMITPGSRSNEIISWPKYGKRPYDVSKTIPYESVLYLSMMSINHLIEYCSALNIDLFFTTWYPDTNLIFSEKVKRWKKSLASKDGYNNLDMSGYLELKNLNGFYNNQHSIDCHQDEKDNSTNNWYVGTDLGSHIGAHQHLHYAEMFVAAIKAKID